MTFHFVFPTKSISRQPLRGTCAILWWPPMNSHDTWGSGTAGKEVSSAMLGELHSGKLTVRHGKSTMLMVFTRKKFGIFPCYYCWWLKSCTTWDVWNPINNGINYLSTGAGFQPSTVVCYFAGVYTGNLCSKTTRKILREKNMSWRS